MRRLGLALAALLAFAGPATAHRGHSTLSVVEIDAVTGAITVTHRVSAHDAEPALIDLVPEAQPSLDDADALAAVVAHGARAFSLADENGPIALTHVETDLAGDDLRLIYTGRTRPEVRVFTVDSALFEQSHADQENQVNVRRARVTKTFVFTPGDGPQTVMFE